MNGKVLPELDFASLSLEPLEPASPDAATPAQGGRARFDIDLRSGRERRQQADRRQELRFQADRRSGADRRPRRGWEPGSNL